MAKNTQLSDTTVNAQGDAMARLLDNGYIKIYDGTQPANANTAVSTQNLLATLRFAATSAPATSAGVITFNAIAAVNAAATGPASWFRCLKSDGTTVVFDGSIATASSNMNFNSVAIQSGAQVSITSFTHTVAAATSGS